MMETFILPEKITGVQETELLLKEDFLNFAGRFIHHPGTVLLLSGGNLDCARHHILALKPWLILKSRGEQLEVHAEGKKTHVHDNPFVVLQKIIRHFRLPIPFPAAPIAAGLLGYLAYDLKDAIEGLPRSAVDDLCLPHLYLTVPSLLLSHDRSSGRTRLFLPERKGASPTRTKEDLAWFNTLATGPAPIACGFRGHVDGHFSNFSRPTYMEAVNRIQEYIASGDAYQVNMSQRFNMEFAGDPFALFRELYRINPAPFFAFINARDHQIVSTSPERFILQDGRNVETRPIKGTRPRGKTPEEDELLVRELTGSIKDEAELSMIVDLLRNDIGKVCEADSVRVSDHKRLEAYHNVYHLVSTITGHLDPEKDSVDLIKAAFPGGSITGCPKVRAMEIIDELEPNCRHIYTGSIGYISFHDTMDLSVAIRTATICNGRIIFSVGGGIVYDSIPSDEFEETLHKGQTLMAACRTNDGEAAKSASWAWLNGRILPLHQARVPAEHPGVQYGDGFFETIRVDGGNPQHLAAHIERFNGAWHHLFPGPPPDLTWDVIIGRIIEKNTLACQAAAVKILALRGSRDQPPFNHTLLVTARPYVHRLEGRNPRGIHLLTYPHPRETPLADYKTLNYLYYHRAGHWAQKHGGDEALILNFDLSASETNTANIVLIKNQEAFFPCSAHALPGIMSQMIRNALIREGYGISTSIIFPCDFFKADLVLLTNSLMGPVPALSLDEKPLRVSWELYRRITGAST